MRGVDRIPLDDSPSPFVHADLCDLAAATSVVDGAEAVIHMGAIPGPGNSPPHETFVNNTLSTYNIMTAAAGQGVRRIVFSSSAFVCWADDPRAFVPVYLPLDEEHPITPFEPYGLKRVERPCHQGRAPVPTGQAVFPHPASPVRASYEVWTRKFHLPSGTAIQYPVGFRAVFAWNVPLPASLPIPWHHRCSPYGCAVPSRAIGFPRTYSTSYGTLAWRAT